VDSFSAASSVGGRSSDRGASVIGSRSQYFASDRSNYITGTVLPVDGRMLAGSPATSNSFEDIRQRVKAG